MKHLRNNVLTEPLFNVLVFQNAVNLRHEQRRTAHRQPVGKDQARGQFDDLLAWSARIANCVHLAGIAGANEQRAVFSNREPPGIAHTAHIFLDLETGRHADFAQVEVRPRFIGGENQQGRRTQCERNFANHVPIIHSESEGQNAISSTAAISTSKNGRLAR